MNDGKENKQSPSELEAVFAAGDAWLRKYGMVTSIAHNAIVTNLYVAFSKVRYVEYFLPRNPEVRKVLVVLHFPTLTLLFSSREKLVNRVVDFLKEYLHNYEITVELRRYKKGVEKSNEIPDSALKLDDDALAASSNGTSQTINPDETKSGDSESHTTSDSESKS
jgi:hypothetical protein